MISSDGAVGAVRARTEVEEHMVLYAIGIGAATFLGTNLDAFVVFTPMLWRTPESRARNNVVLGAAVGNVVVLLSAVIVAYGLSFLPSASTRWVGLIPLGIGIWRLFRPQADAEPSRRPAHGVFSGACVAVALGIDNVAVLAPLLHTLGDGDASVAIAVHLLLFPLMLVGLSAAGPRLHRAKRARRTCDYLMVAACAVVFGRSLLV